MAEPTTRAAGAQLSGVRRGAPGRARRDETGAGTAGRSSSARAPGSAGRARHRAARPSLLGRLRAGLLWPLAALVLVGLVGARPLRGTRLPDDGGLAALAFALSRGETDLGVLSPEGLGAVHTAVYATVTRAFARHATLVGAERELLLVLLLVSAVLLWRTARRLGLPDAACAIVLLAFGALPALAPLHALATPAAFAVPWALLAAWLLASALLTRSRPPAAVAVLAAGATVLAVLLTPDLLLLLGGAGAAALTGRATTTRTRLTAVAGGVLALLGTRVLIGRWHPDPARWGADRPALLLLSALLLLVAGLAGWLLPRLRAVAAGLATTTVLAVAPPSGRAPALLVSLPVAALLFGALAAWAAAWLLARSAASAHRRRPRAALAAGLTAAILLAGLGASATAGLAGAPRSDFGAAAHEQLVDWARQQLPEDTVLTAPPRLAAELVHAGAAPSRVRSRDDVPAAASAGRVLAVRTDPPAGADTVLARLGDLTVIDPRPVPPTAAQVAARRELGRALLANPTTEVPAADAELLAEGRVDPRLLTLLAGLGARYGIGLESLPRVPGEPDGALVRHAVISSVGDAAVPADPAATERLRAWLEAQQEPYAPDSLTEVDGGLRVGHRLATDPDGLVTLPGGR